MLTITGQLTATEFYSAEHKAKFIRHFVRFAEGGFRETMFPKWFYNNLSKTFGHIAHFSREGFFHTWFNTPERQLAFLDHCADWRSYGSPEFTFSDCEAALSAWCRATPIRAKLRKEISEENERYERSVLARLKAKYETT